MKKLLAFLCVALVASVAVAGGQRIPANKLNKDKNKVKKKVKELDKDIDLEEVLSDAYIEAAITNTAVQAYIKKQADMLKILLSPYSKKLDK